MRKKVNKVHVPFGTGPFIDRGGENGPVPIVTSIVTSREKCDALVGDSVNQQATWRGSSRLPDRQGPVQLRFILQNASLYSFAFDEGLDERAGENRGPER